MSEATKRCEHCGGPLAERPGGEPTCLACLMRQGMAETTGGEAFDERAEPDPETVGPYRVVRRIGEGGMGVVYLAEQSGDLERRVAVKVVRPGVGSKQVLARFQLERQTLALMQHPGIARIYDAGTTEEGRPYFVMEYVDGPSITEYCDRERLSNAERIRLFREVCSAVQHAHQRGVIHRDLKPSNILVEDADDGPRPRVIDFGVAKATEKRFMEWSVFTEVGRLIGTPEYMSPEQAGDAERDIDTRTDVYSLGVVLYELLVGVTPLGSEDLRRAGLQALLATVREASFPTPSSRYRTLDETQDAAAENRRTGRAELARELEGELDWIVMRALEREKDDRYGSPADLADDLGRYLDDEPVEAGPPGLAYRLRKFVRRHRAAVGVSAAMLLLLIAGLISTTLMWNRSEAAYAEVLRLADIKRLADYEAQAESLWPAEPDLVPELTAWLEERARPLAGRLDAHRASLAQLRARALPYDDVQRAHDRTTHPLAQALVDDRDYLSERHYYLEAARNNPDLAPDDRAEIIAYREAQIAELEARIAEYEQAVTERRTWRFGDAETQWRHDTLAELVARLETFVDPDPFVGTLASVERRLAFASTVAERTTGGENAARWEAAIRAIEASPHYGGLSIEPQVGLVPLRADPDSGLWEFWHVGTGERPRPGDPWAIGPETGMVFVLVPGGRFTMGASPGDASAVRREFPSMEIEIDPFFVSKYETTQEQWLRLTGDNPSNHQAGGGVGGQEIGSAHPVEEVTWIAADRVLRRAGLALPTEAQWEYAARAGTRTRWWFGDDREGLRGRANVQDATLKATGAPSTWQYETWLEDGYVVHAPVTEFEPNPWGLYGTIGNVAEWCREAFRSPYTRWVDAGDGYRNFPGGGNTRVLRGGSWRSPASATRVSSRGNVSPEDVDPAVGVRAVRALEP